MIPLGWFLMFASLASITPQPMLGGMQPSD